MKPFRFGIFTVARVFAFITVDVSMMLPLADVGHHRKGLVDAQRAGSVEICTRCTRWSILRRA